MLIYNRVAEFARVLKLALDSYLCRRQFPIESWNRVLSEDDLREVLTELFSVESGNRRLAFHGGALSRTVYDTCFRSKAVGQQRSKLFDEIMDGIYPELFSIIRKPPRDPRRTDFESLRMERIKAKDEVNNAYEPSMIPYEGINPYIFTAYSSMNEQLVYPIISALQKRHYRIWWDKGIPPGVAWAGNINRHLKGSTALLLFLSPEAVESEWVQDEVTIARKYKIPIYGIYLVPTTLDDSMEYYLLRIQQINYFEFQSRTAFIDEIEKHLPIKTKFHSIT